MNDRRDGPRLTPLEGGDDCSGELSTRAVAAAFDPARLTQARHLTGMTRKAVAEVLGVSAAAVGQYETGVTRPRPELLPPLAEVLRVPLGFFVVGRPHGRLATTTPHFRGLRSMRAYQRDKAVATVEQIWELAHELERHVELPPVRIPGYGPGEYDGTAGAPAPIDPAAAARRLRREWSLGDGPVQHLVRRLESHGAVVVAPPPDPDAATVDAFSTSGLSRPIIVLTPNRADDVYRHRFTAAHELAHLVLHRDAVGPDPAGEREADQFAAEFLTPRESILPLLPRRLDPRRLAGLSRTWGVSVHSLLYRCRETGLLSDSAASRGYQRLRALADQPGFRAEPVANFPHEQPVMLNAAFDVAAASGLTVEALAARLGWSVDRCQVLLGLAGPTAVRRPRLRLLPDEAGDAGEHSGPS